MSFFGQSLDAVGVDQIDPVFRLARFNLLCA